MQVADRFHLLMNVREAIEKVFKRCNRFLRTLSLAALPSSARAPENDAYAGCRFRLQPHLRGARRGDDLRQWLIDAQRSEIPEFVGLANGSTSDLQAVRGALEHEWSQGQAEDQVHRLKLVKRQMYGRGKLDLLRARMLHAA